MAKKMPSRRGDEQPQFSAGSDFHSVNAGRVDTGNNNYCLARPNKFGDSCVGISKS